MKNKIYYLGLCVAVIFTSSCATNLSSIHILSNFNNEIIADSSISEDAHSNIFSESIIHIPNIKEFNKIKSHVVSYSTPFGTSIFRF